MTTEQKIKAIVTAYAKPKGVTQKELVRMVLATVKNKKYVVKA
jgi:hypothetical protein